jgi:16S rRNA G966 N2-methylase RsmD
LYSHSKINKEKASFAALQASLRNLALEKVSNLIGHGGFVTRRSLEQCSSELLAEFKGNEFKGNKILILAAGLGIDDWAFSFSFNKVISIDTDIELNAISRYNFGVLKRNNIQRIDANASEFLDRNSETFDLVFVDPDRRNEKGRQILLGEHQPNVVELLPKLFAISSKVLIKCSPLYDYEMAILEIPNISTMYSVSKYGEMKELLILAEKDYSEDGISIICSDILKDKSTVSYKTLDKKESKYSATDEIGYYLYEAGSCVVKMRKHHHLAMELNLSGIDISVAYYTSNQINNQFIGRCFKIIKSMKYNSKDCIKYFESKHIKKANIKARGLKFNTEELRKKLKLKEGGADYIFALPYKNNILLIHCTH